MEKKGNPAGTVLPSVRVEQHPSSQELAQAFSLFTETSLKLEGAYQELQGQVQQLTAQLAVANGELRREYEAKEALSSRLSLLLAALPGGVVVLDSLGRVVEANPAAVSILGQQLVGESWGAVEEILQPGEAPNEYLLQKASGLIRILLQHSRLNDAGETVLLLNDTTEAFQLRQQLEHHKKLSAMGEMAASLAHQLRTPLTTALLYASHLGRADLAASERERFASRSLERMRHLERMIQDMLSFVRGQEGEREVVAVSELLVELENIMLPLMQRQAVHFEIINHAADVTLKVDRKAVLGALVNVLENAMQFCGTPGKVELLIEGNGKQVEFQVHDNGQGLADEVLDRLFEPFVTTRNEGTGLGLAIVRNVVSSHGGIVSAGNASAGGAVVRLRLPVWVANNNEVQQ